MSRVPVQTTQTLTKTYVYETNYDTKSEHKRRKKKINARIVVSRTSKMTQPICNWMNRITNEATQIVNILDCEQSLFLSSVSHARKRASSGEAARREKRERHPEKKKESLFFRAFPVSRLQSRACAFPRVLFDGLRKKKTARSL